MNITEKYVEFIVDYIGKDFRAELLEPQEDGVYVSWKIGPIVTMPVKIEVLNRYTRSANIRLSFDKYKVDDLFFMPINSSPDSIVNKTHKKINKIVNKTIIDDGREDEIRKMYADRRARINEMFIQTKSEAKKIENNTSDKIVE